jgi:hypothetical protein
MTFVITYPLFITVEERWGEGGAKKAEIIDALEKMVCGGVKYHSKRQ